MFFFFHEFFIFWRYVLFLEQWQFVTGRSPLGVLIQLCLYLFELLVITVCLSSEYILYMVLDKWLSDITVYSHQICLYIQYLHLQACLCLSTLWEWQCVFTCAGELLRRCGEQKFVSHITGPSTAGNARLLVATLHPVWQPLHVAVTVQWVGTQSPAMRRERRQRNAQSHEHDTQEKSTL